MKKKKSYLLSLYIQFFNKNQLEIKRTKKRYAEKKLKNP